MIQVSVFVVAWCCVVGIVRPPLHNILYLSLAIYTHRGSQEQQQQVCGKTIFQEGPINIIKRLEILLKHFTCMILNVTEFSGGGGGDGRFLASASLTSQTTTVATVIVLLRYFCFCLLSCFH